MSYPGEYIDPLPRITNVQCAMVSGYACARLSREDPLFFAGSGDSDEVQVYLQNSGSADFTVQLKQTRDYSAPGTSSAGTPTGTRFDVGNAQALVPGGTVTVQVAPWMEYLELWCTSGSAGKGFLRAQLLGRTRWQKMAFDKSETVVAPQILNSVRPIPQAPLI